MSPLPIDDGIGDQWNLVELTYTLFVGDCGHSTGGYHGAGVKEIQKWWIFDSGTHWRVCIDGIGNSPFIHVRAKTRFYCRNHTKNYFCSTLRAGGARAAESGVEKLLPA